MPALRDMHEAPNHVSVLKNPQAFGRSLGRCHQTPALEQAMPAVRSTGAWPGPTCARRLADGYDCIVHLQDS
jgi:hypothetical protein